MHQKSVGYSKKTAVDRPQKTFELHNLGLYFRFFDVSCGFQYMSYRGGYEVDHGDEGLDIPISTGSGPCCLK